MSGSSPRALRDLAVQVAGTAADLVRDRRHGVAVAATKTSATDVVTEVDRASERLIEDLIRRTRPDDGFLGEEGGGATGSTGVRWVVDPIDGTVNFLYGIPQYAVSVAAEYDGVVVAGAVVHVPGRVVYDAFRGGGSRRDGEQIAVRGPVPLSQRLVSTGFSYDPGLRARQAKAWARLLPRVRDLRRLGSSALDVCGVAEGSVDAYVEEGVHVWDYAASTLIAREAGARAEVTRGAGGQELLICAPEHGFAEFRAAVAEAGFCAE